MPRLRFGFPTERHWLGERFGSLIEQQFTTKTKNGPTGSVSGDQASLEHGACLRFRQPKCSPRHPVPEHDNQHRAARSRNFVGLSIFGNFLERDSGGVD